MKNFVNKRLALGGEGLMRQLALLVTYHLQADTAISVVRSLTSAATALPIVQRRPYRSHPLQLRRFSTISRATRHAKVSIQRYYGSVPPVISADYRHKLQFNV